MKPEDLTDEDIWSIVEFACIERNKSLLAFCTIGLKARAGGTMNSVRKTLADAINARKRESGGR